MLVVAVIAAWESRQILTGATFSGSPEPFSDIKVDTNCLFDFFLSHFDIDINDDDGNRDDNNGGVRKRSM